MKTICITFGLTILVSLTSCCGCITQPMPALRPMPAFDDSDCHIDLDEPVKVFDHKGK